jgi:serine phosphatase RsbU (regulator of sigma subunit)
MEWAAAALLALLALGSARRGRAYRLLLAAAFVAVPMLSWLAFSRTSLLIDPARPLLVGGGGVAGVAIGLFALARIERERLREELVGERIAAAAAESELRVARDIQLGMVPPRSRLKAIDPRVDLDALLEPAKSVGGDFYDAVRIGDRQIGFLTADVAGKGVPAALFMAMSKALTSTALSHMAADPAGLAEAINSELLKDNHEAMSVAMLVGVLDLDSGVVRLVCAGHEDPFLLPAGGGLKRLSLDGGPPFGVTDFPYPMEQVTLARGDTLILVTDGVTEAQDPQGRLFGRDRLLTIGTPEQLSATAICEAVRDQVRQFEAGDDPTDDFTVMAIRRV